MNQEPIANTVSKSELIKALGVTQQKPRRHKMKFEHYPDLGAAIPRKSKLGLLIFNHAFFIGESTTMGTQVVICSQQYTGPEGYKRTWFKVVRPSITPNDHYKGGNHE